MKLRSRNLLFTLLGLLLSLLHNPAQAQIKLIKKLLSNQVDSSRKASFLPVPVIGYSQEKGLELGIGSIYSYYMDKADLQNRSSNFSSTLSYSTKKTYNFSIKADAWTSQNKYHLLGEIRLRNQPFYYYGTGNHTLAQDKTLLDFKLFRLAGEIEKNWGGQYYTGLGLHYQKESLANQGQIDYKTQTLLLGISQSIDTRNSNNYTSQGFYGKVSLQYAPQLFRNKQYPNQNYQGAVVKVNLRQFWSLAPKFVLGLQGIYHGLQGKNIPTMHLPQLGNDEIMRGYLSGRFRDKHLLAAQTELRYRFMPRFGAVVFAGTGQVAPNAKISRAELKPNYGFGGRYFFDPAKGLSIRFDYGIGEKIAGEKRQQGFYISFAEAF